jgi:ubiquinone/menaquinone biosynthesis C-methylase UbiE
MDSDKTAGRQRVRELAQQILPSGDFAGFFDAVYAGADGDTNGVPWADLEPHPLALSWLQQHDVQGQGKRALVVGCGLGDDAEELAKRGFHVTAFDVSPNAIAWAKQRFPDSSVNYQATNLLEAPAVWQQAFDFVLEIYTIQALLVKLRTQAIESIARFVAPGGQLLVVCRGRDNDEELGTMPWPLSRTDLAQFEQAGLRETSFEDIRAGDQRHFRIVYER